MAETRVVKQVFPGKSSEYYTAITPSEGDILYMAFDGELTVDEILLRVGSSGTLTCSIDIIYPSSTLTQDIASPSFTGGGEWSLNDGTNYAAKWYQVPSGTTIQFTFDPITSADKVEIVVIGR